MVGTGAGPRLTAGCPAGRQPSSPTAPEQAEMGFEPMNNGFAIRPSGSVTNQETETCETSTNHLGALLGALRAESPDLATVVEAWPKLPETVRAGILAMINAAKRTPAE